MTSIISAGPGVVRQAERVGGKGAGGLGGIDGHRRPGGPGAGHEEKVCHEERTRAGAAAVTCKTMVPVTVASLVAGQPLKACTGSVVVSREVLADSLWHGMAEESCT